MKAPALTILVSATALSLVAFADVRDTPVERAFSLPSGTPSLVVARGDWIISREQRRSGDSAIYYMLTSESTQLVLSVYIDKSNACKTSEGCLSTALENQSYREAKDLKTFDAGAFKAAQFYLDQPKGLPLKQAHILAALYTQGHWFDIHISKSSTDRPDMAPLLELLGKLSVR